MFAQIFLKMTKVPAFRRIVWKPIYEFLPRVMPMVEWKFMNYGYLAEGTNALIHLEAKDESERYPLQLYHALATKVHISGKDVLEVGSGRGGGAYYIARYLKPSTMTALDISHNAIKFARAHMIAPGLNYLQGDAEDIRFSDELFDVVINVESSHAYGSFDQFITEVYRVLRPGGYFLITDLRPRKDMEQLRKRIDGSPFTLIEEENVTNNVVAAIEADHETKMARIKNLVPGWLRPSFQEFAGVRDSEIHSSLKTGARQYYLWVLQKPDI